MNDGVNDGTDDAVLDGDARSRLEAWLAPVLGAERVSVEDVRLLGGGAIQQNVALALRMHGAGPSGCTDECNDERNDERAHERARGRASGRANGRTHELAAVLRRDAPATIDESRGRAEEHALLVAAHAAGVTVPRPVAFCTDASVIGAPFSVVERVAGVALGQKVVKDAALGGEREALVDRLGAELARIHAMDRHSPGLGFLGAEVEGASDVGDAPLHALRRLRDSLDALGEARPALEIGLRLLERQRPVARERVLLHRDFRTGNFMLDGHGLTAVLDWEFADAGDPWEDLGWFCARCWRFSRPNLEAGGLGTRAAFYRGYERASGRTVDDASVRWWERFAHLRWAVIALQQGARHASGRERSLSLALTGELAHALELHVLDTSGVASAAPATAPVPASAPNPDPNPDPAMTARLDLLGTAREALADIAAHARGGQRLAVLMSAAAIGSAERSLAHAGRLGDARRATLRIAGATTSARLVRAVRAGDHDDDAALATTLLRECALRAWVARPADVSAALRARHGLLPGDGPPA